jgi:hypothetical protein
MSYKGFDIKRRSENVLFYIEPEENMVLPAMLSGLFTKLPDLHNQIDEYLKRYPHMTADQLVIQKPDHVLRHRELG